MDSFEKTLVFFVLCLLVFSTTAPLSSAQDMCNIMVPVKSSIKLPNGAEFISDYGTFQLFRIHKSDLSKINPADLSKCKINSKWDIIEFRSFPVKISKYSPDFPEHLRSTEIKGASLHLIHFVGPTKSEWLKEIEKAGISVVHYVRNYGYLVWADESGRQFLKTMVSKNQFVDFETVYEPFFKLTSSIQKQALTLEKTDTVFPVSIQIFNHTENVSTKKVIEELAVDLQCKWTDILNYQYIYGKISLKDIITIAQLPDVYSIIEAYPRKKLDEVQDIILTGNLDASNEGPDPAADDYLTWLSNMGFSETPGDYPVVDVSDDGIGNGTVISGDYTLHYYGNISNDTRLAYVGNCSADSSGDGQAGHGHLNLSIIGSYDDTSGSPYQDSDGYQRGLGVSPYGRMGGTKIFTNSGSFSLSKCSNSETGLLKQIQDSGALISSHSWGSSPYNCSGYPMDYDTLAQAYDYGVRDADQSQTGNQELTLVISAGNAGTCGAESLGSPGIGKNVITVGASENDRPTWSDGCGIGTSGADDAMDVISFSSRGPAIGGRAKPEIIAPGTHIQATASTNSSYDGSGVCDQYQPTGQTIFASSSGTSHSCPAISGVSSLYYWWLQNNLSISAPSPALIKAYLMAHVTYLTGVDANDTLPSNTQGYGMPNMEMAFDDTPRFIINQTELFTSTGNTYTWVGAVADNTRPVMITMAYTDAPGATGTSPEVNDLDLEADINGTIYLGNVFSGRWSTTGGSADADNNYEAIFRPVGTSGTIEITITASNISGDGVLNNGDSTDQDFALVCYNCISCTDPGTPSGLSASPNGNNSIRLTWTDNAPSADTFNIYRATGSCPQASYTLINSGVSSTTYDDNTVSGGFTYAYVVTGVDSTGGCETVYSNCDDALATGACVTPPIFAGIQSVTNAAQSSCRLDLAWNAATNICGTGVVYNIYRSENSTFTPDGSNNIASCESGTTYQDSDASLTNGIRYYYIVRAEDNSSGSCSGNEDTNLIRLSGIPTGPITNGTWTDDLESYTTMTDAESAGWTHGADAGSDDWSLSTAQSHSSSHSFISQSIPSVTDKFLISPPQNISASTELSFWHMYNFETGFDGGVIEISIDNGVNWSDIGHLITTGVYNDTISSSYSSPIGGQDAWSGSIASFAQVVVDLSSYDGETALVRWRFACDSSASSGPWYIDDISMSNVAVYGICNDSSCAAVSASIDSATPNPACTGQSVSFEGSGTGDGSLTYEWDFEDDGTFDDTGTTTTHSYSSANTYTVRLRVTDSCSSGAQVAEDTVSVTVYTQPGSPTITGISDVNNCLLNGIQIAFNSGTGAARHDLYRGGSLAQSNYSSGATFNPPDSGTYSYMVRAVNNSCTADSNSMNGTDINNGPGTPVLVNVTDVSPCALTGVTVTYTPAPNSPTSHTLVVDGTTEVPNFVSGTVYEPSNSSSHNYQIRAEKSSCSALSNTIAETDENLSTPPIPTTSSAKGRDGSVDLTWTDVSGEDQYRILRATVPGGPYSQIDTVGANVTSYNDSTVSNGTTYFYVLQSVNTAGPCASTESSEKSATPNTVTGVTEVSSTVSTNNLRLIQDAASSTGYYLDFEEISFALGYHVYEGTIPIVEPEGLDHGTTTNVCNIAAASCTDLGNGWLRIEITPSSSNHYFLVTAYGPVNQGTAGYDSASAERDVAENVCVACSVPGDPVLNSATPGDRIVDLAWSNVSGETGYRIYRATVTGGPYSAIDTTAADVVTYQDTGLTNGTPYYYVVTAFDNSCESGQSNELSATPACIPPAVPTLSSATPGDTIIDLVWTNVAGETGYNIYRRIPPASFGSVYDTVAADTTTYQDTGLTNGTEYAYVITAFNAGCESGQSNEESAIPSVCTGEHDYFVMDNDGTSTNFWDYCDPASVEVVTHQSCPSSSAACTPGDDYAIGWDWSFGDTGMHWLYFITDIITLDCTKDLLFDLCYGFDGYSSNLTADFYVYYRCASSSADHSDCTTVSDSGPTTPYWTLAWSDVGTDWGTSCSTRDVSSVPISLDCSCDYIEIMIATNFDAYGDYLGIGNFHVYYDDCDTQCTSGQRNCSSKNSLTNVSESTSERRTSVFQSIYSAIEEEREREYKLKH